MGVLLMTDLSKLSETELLAIWNKDNFGLKGQLYKLEQEYIEAKEILDNWQNKDHPLYERHKDCVDGLVTRIQDIQKKAQAVIKIKDQIIFYHDLLLNTRSSQQEFLPFLNHLAFFLTPKNQVKFYV